MGDPTCSAEFLDQVAKIQLQFEEKYVRHIVNLMARHQKPIVGVSMLKDAKDSTVYAVDENAYKGVFFSAPEQAVQSLAKMVEYRRFLDRG